MKKFILFLSVFLAAIHIPAQRHQQEQMEQKAIDITTGEPLSEEEGDTERISGKIIKTEQTEYGRLEIPNYAELRTNDGTVIISHPSKAFRVGEKVTLEGYFKTTYYANVKNVTQVFYVTRIINSSRSGNHSKNSSSNLGSISNDKNNSNSNTNSNSGSTYGNSGNNNTNSNSGSIGNTGSAVSKSEAQEALDFHNQVRNDVGAPPLSWSAELSEYAQEWADFLAKKGCELEHRSSLGRNPKNYGENLYGGRGGVRTALDASKAWYSEIKDFKNVVLNSSNWYNTGHYSQMVWRNTSQVGIGSAKCPNGAYIIVANYNPPGNYMGQKAY